MLSRKTKYGLKALSYLARENSEDPVQIVVISKAENISQKFLESILLILKKAEILQSKKGKGGGYFLAKPAREITIASVMRVLEGPIALFPCVSLNFYEKCDDCPDEDACNVHRLMVQVRDSNLNIFENTSLADLVAAKSQD
jgi:Rrf2 family protein